MERRRHELQIGQAKLSEHLRAGANQSVVLRGRRPLLRVEQLVQIFKNRVRCLGAAKQDHHATPLGSNVLHCGTIGPSRHGFVIQACAQKIPQGIHRLHTHRYRTGRAEIPYAHGEVQGVIDEITEGVQGALTPLSVHGLGAV